MKQHMTVGLAILALAAFLLAFSITLNIKLYLSRRREIARTDAAEAELTQQIEETLRLSLQCDNYRALHRSTQADNDRLREHLRRQPHLHPSQLGATMHAISRQQITADLIAGLHTGKYTGHRDHRGQIRIDKNRKKARSYRDLAPIDAAEAIAQLRVETALHAGGGLYSPN